MLLVGSTDKKYLIEGIEDYKKRLIHYLPFDIRVIPDIKNSRHLTSDQQNEKEGKALLDLVSPGDELILLDVDGVEFSSAGFAGLIEKRMVSGIKQLTFAVGGPYGFSEAVCKRADKRISLSRLTFPHQLVRLLFIEQLYRVMTIIKGEPYHHA